jgi:hypothetical protein
MVSSALQVKVTALLAVLDDDIGHVQTVLRRLDQLRSLLIKRDDAGLEQLLTGLASEAEIHAVNEQKRQDLRRELADELQCSLEHVTLSRLLSLVPDMQRRAVSERRKTLRSLVNKLRREHALTTMLLADCARFNQSLLRVFFGQSGRGAVRYGANGAAVRPPGASLMSLHF